jgi:hypothetical protein
MHSTFVTLYNPRRSPLRSNRLWQCFGEPGGAMWWSRSPLSDYAATAIATATSAVRDRGGLLFLTCSIGVAQRTFPGA